ncbi:MAG: pyridoxamine 5'-phosphate oxidase family protein [Halobacteriota archaeon]
MDDGDTTLRGIEMSDDELERFLHEQGHGTLSLARDGEAYAVPISFGFDGERVFFSLIEFGDASRKLDFVEHTDRACLVTYDVQTRHVWKSALVLGSLASVDEDEHDHIAQVLEDNAWFPNIYPPIRPITGIHRMALTPVEVTGRKGEGYQSN